MADNAPTQQAVDQWERDRRARSKLLERIRAGEFNTGEGARDTTSDDVARHEGAIAEWQALIDKAADEYAVFPSDPLPE